jgi:hypothetical protein
VKGAKSPLIEGTDGDAAIDTASGDGSLGSRPMTVTIMTGFA